MKKHIRLLIVFSAVILCAMTANAQTSAFTYQGRFTDTTIQQPTNGTYPMTFRLYDAATGGNQIPNNTTANTSTVSVVNNLFTVKLDFTAAAFNTAGARYLEIQVGNIVLTPRQEITATPFAMRSLNAANADGLGGVAANQFVRTSDARLSDARTPTAGSADYIQNRTTQQGSTNFNISGSGLVGGTLGIGTPAAPQTVSLQVGGGIHARGGTPGAGGAGNNGYAFADGGDSDSGMFSTADGTLQFYANNEERIRITGGIDLIAGSGGEDVIGGAGAGITLRAGSGGDGNTGGVGATVTLRGGDGGGGVITGGTGAGIILQAGSGGNAATNGGNGASITLQPGSGGSGFRSGASGNVVLAPTNGNVGIGIAAPTSRLHVVGSALVEGNLNLTGTGAANVFNAQTQYNLGGSRILSGGGTNNLFVGIGAGGANTNGQSNSFFGNNAGQTNTTGDNNTALGFGANFSTNNLNYATAVGAGATADANNTLVLGRTADTVRVPGALNVSGTLPSDGVTKLCLNPLKRLAVCLPGLRPAGNGEPPENSAAQQEKIESLETRLKQQQTVIDELKKLVCAGNPNADVCRQP